MGLRRLLSTAYAALARGRDEKELEKFDRELEAEPQLKRTAPAKRKPSPSENRGLELLMAAAKMPQSGAGVRPKRKKAAAKKKAAAARPPRPREAT